MPAGTAGKIEHRGVRAGTQPVDQLIDKSRRLRLIAMRVNAVSIERRSTVA